MDIDEQEYYQLNQVDLYIEQNKCGTGNLVLTNKRVRWIPSSGTPKEWNWRSIVMHAVSKDSSHFPYASIYCQIHTPKGSLDSGSHPQLQKQVDYQDAMEQEPTEEDGSDPGEDLDRFTEVRFVPPNEEALEVLFSVFSKGAEMNPDPVEEDEGDFFFNAPVIDNSNNANTQQSNLEQFQDADDGDGGSEHHKSDTHEHQMQD
jgi:hypothetical protein